MWAGIFLCSSVQMMLGWSLQGPMMETNHPTVTASTVLLNTPCFVDNIFAVLREEVGNDGVLTNNTEALFGLCAASNVSVISQLAAEIRRDWIHGVELLIPTTVLVSEEAQSGVFLLTLVLPPSPLLKLNPVLLLTFEYPFTRGDITFTSQSLQPDTQSACVSADTRHIVLTGGSSENSDEQKWIISVQIKTSDTKGNLKDSLIGGNSGSSISITPLLLFSRETGTNTRHASGGSQASLQTTFLCELKRFLSAVRPQEPSEAPQVQLDSLESLPPLILGLLSSETLLAGMINSSAPTIFSFASWGSAFPLHEVELALSAALLEELRQRLEGIVTEMMETLKEEKVAESGAERLRRLKELSVWQKNQLVTGEKQYCAFLLLKALQTVARAYDLQRRLRATRANPSNPVSANVCGLRSLTVSLEKVLVGPNTANIYNCHGLCTFPLTNANNHAVLLHYHTERGQSDERAPCCVPVAYEGLNVMELNQEGAYISTKPDVIATECGCR